MSDSNPDAKPDTRWFHDRMAERKISQRELARRIGIDPAGLSLTLRGKRTMRMHEAVDLARLLGVPLLELLVRSGVDHPMPPGDIAVTGWLDAHGEVHCEPDLGAIQRPHGLPTDTTAVQCRTAGSDLDYMDGWLLFVSRPVEPPTIDHLGRLCLVRLTGSVIYLAQLRRGYAPGRWNLAGPVAHATDVAVDWTAPVLNIRT